MKTSTRRDLMGEFGWLAGVRFSPDCNSDFVYEFFGEIFILGVSEIRYFWVIFVVRFTFDVLLFLWISCSKNVDSLIDWVM